MQVLMSQPAQHSRKPFLGTLLAPFVVEGFENGQEGERLSREGHEGQEERGEPREGISMSSWPEATWGLEVFAREIRSEWTGVGDECLLFNHEMHMQPLNQAAAR